LEIREQNEMVESEGSAVKCKECGSDVADPHLMTQINIRIGVQVAPDDVVLRAHVVDLVYAKLLEWMHEDSYETIDPTYKPVDVIDTIVAYSIAGQG